MPENQTVLFHSTIFGPIHSRRLGVSLGVNLSPNDGKICSFDCVYCEAGFNSQGVGTTGFPTREQVYRDLAAKLSEMKESGDSLDVITFSGNGEPTLHPCFGNIVDDVTALRDKFFPKARISVLCNSTRLGDGNVVHALKKVDNCILKLDSAVQSTFEAIDRPNGSLNIDTIIERLKDFSGKCIIQTMFLKNSDGSLDNTTQAEVDALIQAYKQIRPSSIMIYSLDRPTPMGGLVKIPIEELKVLGENISNATGIVVEAY